MINSSYDTASEAFEHIYHGLITQGSDRGNGTRFVKNAAFYINNPLSHPVYPKWRRFNTRYARHEMDWYDSQDRSPHLIGQAASIWKYMGKTLNSNYGFQLHREQQFSNIVNELASDGNTRRAVMSVYDGKEYSQYAKDTPCLISLTFDITNDTLSMAVHFRSQDIVYGFCNDFHTLMEYMQRVYRLLSYKIYEDLKFGDVHWFVNDLHIYEKHYEMYLR